MKLKITLALFLLSVFIQSNAQVILEGRLLTDEKVSVVNTRIGVAGGPSDITDSKGQFRIKLPLDFIEGERVILVVSKENWVINYPLDGEWNLPNIKYQQIQTTDVIIVPYGSKALWSHERIEKYIALLSDEITKFKKEGEKTAPLDFSYYLSEWATKYGFTPQDVKEAFDQWAEQVKDTADYRTLGLKAFYEKNLQDAASNFEKAALQVEKKLKALTDLKMQEIINAYQNWKDAGNSYFNLYQYLEALHRYLRADSLISTERLPNKWVEIHTLIGNSKLALGVRVKGRDSKDYINEAIDAYRFAYQYYNRENMPLEWAMTKMNIGNAKAELGIRSLGDESKQLLSDAIDNYRLALQVITRDHLPQQWSAIQINLGITLKDQGLRIISEEGTVLLKEAVDAFHLALQVRTRENLPIEWAMTQINLGAVHEEQGIRTIGEESKKLLKASINANLLALEVITYESFPQDWATTQNNLGIASKNLGLRTMGEKSLQLLKEAVDGFRLALRVRTREHLPQDWAKTQNNLGNALMILGERTSGEKSVQLLKEAVDAFRLALQVFSHEYLPQD